LKLSSTFEKGATKRNKVISSHGSVPTTLSLHPIFPLLSLALFEKEGQEISFQKKESKQENGPRDFFSKVFLQEGRRRRRRRKKKKKKEGRKDGRKEGRKGEEKDEKK